MQYLLKTNGLKVKLIFIQISEGKMNTHSIVLYIIKHTEFIKHTSFHNNGLVTTLYICIPNTRLYFLTT